MSSPDASTPDTHSSSSEAPASSTSTASLSLAAAPPPSPPPIHSPPPASAGPVAHAKIKSPRSLNVGRQQHTPSVPSPKSVAPPAAPPGLHTSTSTGNAFSRFMSKIEFKGPTFDFGRKGEEKKRGSFSLAGKELISFGYVSKSDPQSMLGLLSWHFFAIFPPPAGVPLMDVDVKKESKEGGRGGGGGGGNSVIHRVGITPTGERVHAKEDNLGVSAVVEWSSPVRYAV